MYHKVGDVARASTVSTVCRCCSLLPSVSHFRELPPFLSLYSKHTEWEWAEGRREGLPLHRNPHLSHRGWKTNKVRLNSVCDAGFLCAWMRFRKRWLTVSGGLCGCQSVNQRCLFLHMEKMWYYKWMIKALFQVWPENRGPDRMAAHYVAWPGFRISLHWLKQQIPPPIAVFFVNGAR